VNAYGKMSPQKLREKQTTTHTHNCVELFKQYEAEGEHFVTLYYR
jgi:hypothetical protein